MNLLSRISSYLYDWLLQPNVEASIRRLLPREPADQLAFDVTRFVVFNQIPGDYFEFGVFQGKSFSQMYKLLERAWQGYRGNESFLGHQTDEAFFARKRFFAFDSFEGLPVSHANDTPGHFHYEGTYSASQAQFMEHIKREGIDMSRVVVVPGWFDRSLTPETKSQNDLSAAALVFIDCDLYESTVPVLNFITDLIQDGTVIVVDDYFRYRGHPEKGIQRAMNEWLSRNPDIGIQELARCSANRVAFVCYRRQMVVG